MSFKLISHLTPTVALLADDLNYVLIIRNNPNQLLGNGRHYFLRSLEDCFRELLEYKIRYGLGDGQDKTVEQMLEVIQTTRREMKEIIKPFEDIGSHINI